MLFLRERQCNEPDQRRNDRMLELVKNALEQAAEERRQAAEERQAFLEALNRLTDAIAQDGPSRQ